MTRISGFTAAVIIVLFASAGLGGVVAYVLSTSAHGGTVAGHGTAASAARPESSPIASASPSPAVPAAPGRLGAGPRLVSGRAGLVAYAGQQVMESADGGANWRALAPPSGGSSLVVDPSDLAHVLAGGDTLRVTTDAGRTWAAAQTPAPAPGPWQPVLISPTDGTIWFVAHQGHLARTRDAAVTWRDLPGLPSLEVNAGMVPGAAAGQFVLYTGGRAFELDNDGQQVKELPSLPAGLTFREMSIAGGTPGAARASDGKAYLQRGPAWVDAGAGVGGPIVVAVSGRVWIGDGRSALGGAGAVSYSTDSGTSWQKATGLPADQSVEAITLLGPAGDRLIAYCMGGDVASSADGGHTWTILSQNLRSA